MWFILAGMNHLDAIRKLAILVATALAAAIAPTLAQPASQVDENRIFDMLADTLIVQIDKAIAPQMVGSKNLDQAMVWLNKSYKTLNNEKPRIAIWPFDKNKIRISQAIAAEFNAELRSRMITHAGGRYEFIAPDAMANAFQNLRNSGVLGDKDENAVAAFQTQGRQASSYLGGRHDQRVEKRYSVTWR